MDAQLPFTKMQGTGNDFIVIDNRDHIISLNKIIDMAPTLCNRRFGIGADGILLLQPVNEPTLDYTMIYRNADGSDAGMCGNGARCLARFANRNGLGEKLAFNVQDHAYRAHVKGQSVRIQFPIQTKVQEIHGITDQLIYQIHTGTEHIVLQVPADKLEQEDELRKQGRHLRYHKEFHPPGTNVNFLVGKDTNSLKLQTYERGVENLTLACGTGAIASALCWHHIQQLNSMENISQISVKGGELEVSFSFDQKTSKYKNITLTGPAEFVFSGIYNG